MIRNLKILGLALVASFAMSAMVAAAAQAQKSTVITTEGTVDELRVRSAAITPGEFTRTGRAIACKVAQLDGNATNEHKTFTSTEPTFAECSETVLKKTATIDTNGCKFQLELSHNEPAATFTATGELYCPVGKEVTITVFNTSDHTKTPLCVYHVPGQPQNEGTIELTNKAAGTKFPTHKAVPDPEKVTAKNWVEAHVDLAGIKSTRSTGSALTCGAAVDDKAVLEGTFEIYGETGGQQVGVTVSTKS